MTSARSLHSQEEVSQRRRWSVTARRRWTDLPCVGSDLHGHVVWSRSHRARRAWDHTPCLSTPKSSRNGWVSMRTAIQCRETGLIFLRAIFRRTGGSRLAGRLATWCRCRVGMGRVHRRLPVGSGRRCNKMSSVLGARCHQKMNGQFLRPAPWLYWPACVLPIHH